MTAFAQERPIWPPLPGGLASAEKFVSTKAVDSDGHGPEAKVRLVGLVLAGGLEPPQAFAARTVIGGFVVCTIPSP